MKCLVALVALAHFNGPLLVAPSPADPLVSSADLNPGFKRFDGFPTLDLVEESVGLPDRAATALIADPGLRARVESGAYTSLRVLDLLIHPKLVKTRGAILEISYVVSVRERAGPERGSNANPGTIEVTGRLLVDADGSKLRAVVDKLADSTPIRAASRRS